MVIVGLGESDEVSAPDFIYTLLTDRLSVEDKKKKLAQKYGLKMTEEIKMEVTEMCNLSSMIAEENQLIGEERGRIIGEKRGFVKGEDSKSREISLKLYSENKSIEYEFHCNTSRIICLKNIFKKLHKKLIKRYQVCATYQA